ncbi:MAG TPA: ATPase, T2SS/T4P/T4SS family, partial [Frankiaceae bacterium]|nr:ATPase, T2SS/T4P/T4SS family [Frankiaceae bacterium]
AGELQIDHPHVVRLEGRTVNVEGAGGVSLRELLRQALRMRPDRLVVGEVRGAEVLDLLVALNTGHDGGMATVHANAAVDVPARLEALGALAGMDRAAVHSQLAAGIDLVLHLGRRRSGRRVLDDIAVVQRGRGGLVELASIHGRGAPGREGLERLLDDREAAA